MNNLSPALRTAVVYQHFTLREWQLIVKAIKESTTLTHVEKLELLIKFPSSAL